MTSGSIKHIWEKIVDMGNHNLESRSQKTLGRIFNFMIFILVISSTASLISEVILGHFYGTINSAIICLVIYSIAFLKAKGRQEISSFIFNIFLPFGISGLAVLYTDVSFIQIYFCAFLISGVLYSKQLTVKYFFVVYNICLFVFVNWYQSKFGSVTGNNFHYISNIGLAINFFLYFLVLIFQIVNRLIIYGDEIDELNNELKVINQNLSKEKEDLMRLISHDLKAPLVTIESFTNIINQEVQNIEDSEIPVYSNFVIEGVAKMKTMIHESLQFAKNKDHNNKAKEDFDLNKLVDDIKSDLKNEFGNFELTKKNQLPIINSNYVAYKKIFQNLIQNGLKYNDSNKKRIEISFHKEDKNQIYKVIDNGIGIAKELKESVFRKYNRGDHSKEINGSGLGLAITKEMVESLNGKIDFESQNSKGTIFTVTIPDSH